MRTYLLQYVLWPTIGARCVSSITSRIASNCTRVHLFKYQLTPVVKTRSLLERMLAARGLRDGSPGCSADPNRICSYRPAISSAPGPCPHMKSRVTNGCLGVTPQPFFSPVMTQL